jgi:Tfp pilus assembly protein PilN
MPKGEKSKLFIGEKMSKILGVNIDSGSVSVSLMDSRFRSVKRVKFERLVLPEGREDRNRKMTEILADFRKDYKPAGAVIGLPLQYFSWRTIEVVSMKRPDMQKALYYELEKYLPLPMDEYIFDFIVTGAGKTGPNMARVFVFSIKRDVLNEILNPVKDAELDILSVRCSTIDTLSGVLELSGEKHLDGVFLNTADNTCEIAALYDSMPVLFKKVPINADIAEEVAALSLQHPGRLYIAGSLPQSVAGKFNGIKCQISVPDQIVSSFVKKTGFDLNFLPEELVKEKKDYYPYIIGSLAAAAVMFFLLSGLVGYYKDWHAVTRVEKKIAKMQRRASGLLEAQKKLDFLQNDRRALLEFQSRSNQSIRTLSVLSRTLPPEAWLISLVIDDKGKIEMEGFSSKTADFVVALEESKAFRNISFSAPIISKDREERFALKMEVQNLE